MRRLALIISWLAILLAPSVAQAVVVERIVAVVGDEAILLTDVRKRARPYLARLYAQVPKGPQRAGAESRLMRDMLEKMVDERLEAQAAEKQNMRVTAEEVDRALGRIARSAGVPLSKLYEDVEANTGMSKVEYRQEIRRQVLEGKLLNRFAQNQRVTQAELENMLEKLRKKERKILLYQPAWIVLRVGEDPSPDLLRSRMAQARDIVRRARGGADFHALAKQFSEDPATVSEGGDLGIRVPAKSPRAQTGEFELLAAPLEKKALMLDQGEVSDPFRFKGAIVVMKIMRRQPSRYTSLDDVRSELMERVRAEKLQKIKERWLKDLRERTHVDIRM